MMIYYVVESSLSALGPSREGKLGTRNGSELELALSQVWRNVTKVGCLAV